MNAPAYPKTRKSGVSWLGAVPEHWEVRRLKFAVSCNDETLPENTDPDTEIEYVDISSVSLAEGITSTETFAFEKAPSRARRKVRDGDTIVSTVRTYLKAIAPINNPPENLIVSTGFAVIRPLEIMEPSFLGYFLQSQGFVDSVVANSKGVSYPAINPSELVCIPVSYPENKNEQQAIAGFLDRKTGQIDELIGKKKELIKKLNEQRSALITHAVTKGLDDSVPMKNSGIAWLGKVPKHWDVRRMKECGKLRAGAGFPHEEQGAENEAFPFYKVGDLVASSDGKIMGQPPNTISQAVAEKLRAAIIPTGSVVYAKIGAALLLNRRRITAMPCCIDNNMTAYIPEQKVAITDWAYYWLSILDFGVFVNPGAVPSFSEGYQSVLPLIIPPLSEQRTIAEFLDEKTGKIDGLIQKTETAIQTLEEYRTALITAAVTGKIDVREAQQ